MRDVFLEGAKEGRYPVPVWLPGSGPGPTRHVGTVSGWFTFYCGSLRIIRQMATSSVTGKVLESH